jgi:hypothetical protein
MQSLVNVVAGLAFFAVGLGIGLWLRKGVAEAARGAGRQ